MLLSCNFVNVYMIAIVYSTRLHMYTCASLTGILARKSRRWCPCRCWSRGIPALLKLPLKISIDIIKAVFSSNVNKNAGWRLASIAATKATVADATTRRAHPLLQYTYIHRHCVYKPHVVWSRNLHHIHVNANVNCRTMLQDDMPHFFLLLNCDPKHIHN